MESLQNPPRLYAFFFSLRQFSALDFSYWYLLPWHAPDRHHGYCALKAHDEDYIGHCFDTPCSSDSILDKENDADQAQ